MNITYVAKAVFQQIVCCKSSTGELFFEGDTETAANLAFDAAKDFMRVYHERGYASQETKKRKERAKRASVIEVRDGVKGRKCSVCKTWKPAEEFYAYKSSKTGMSSRCKKCHSALRGSLQKSLHDAESKILDDSHIIRSLNSKGFHDDEISLSLIKLHKLHLKIERYVKDH